MKKIISLVLVAIMAVSVFALASCGGNTGSEETTAATEASALKFGFGVVSAISKVTDADGDTDGGATVDTTAVAVLLDAEGKFVDLDIDTLQAKTAWTSAGVAAAATEAKTKYDKAYDYNMAAHGKKHDGSEGQPLEWFEQIDAFIATAKGKTLDEVKAFVGEDTYTTGDLATAGCTISVADIMKALDKAVANAVDTTANGDLDLAFATSISNADASEEKDGKITVAATIVAAVVDAEGKVLLAKTDCAQTAVTFNATGAATVDAAAELKTKLELGDAYNMAAYGTKHDGSEGQPLEWYAQAAAFDAALVGKTAADFAALAGEDGYATGDLATAGCTMAIADMIKAAEAASTIA